MQELKKVQDVYSHGRGGTDYQWEKRLADLVRSINEYLMARIEMINMYPLLGIRSHAHIINVNVLSLDYVEVIGVVK